jgi:hypothetical protein
MGDETDDKLLAFLYSSITDIQSTIRANDTKAAVVMGILILALSNTGKIYLNFSKLHQAVYCGQGQWQLWALIMLFFVTWLAAFIAAIRAVMAIHNPASRITVTDRPSGTFYNGELYDLGLGDVFVTRNVTSKVSLEDHVKNLPDSIENIKQELVFEQMKLAFIRDMKAVRLKWAYILVMVWLACGFLSRILFLYHCSR